MRGVNLVVLAGNLGGDPEMKNTQSGIPIAWLSLAISSKAKGRDGNYEDRLEWVRVVCFSSVAETCNKYLGKGDAVFVVGRIRSREFEDRDGVKRKTTEIVADRVQFLTSEKREKPEEENGGGYTEDEVPFSLTPAFGDEEGTGVGGDGCQAKPLSNSSKKGSMGNGYRR